MKANPVLAGLLCLAFSGAVQAQQQAPRDRIQRSPDWGAPPAAMTAPVNRAPASASASSAPMAQRRLPEPADGATGGQAILELLSAAPDTPVRSGGRSIPAAEAQRQLLAPVFDGLRRAQPQRNASSAAGPALQLQTIARGNAALRGQFPQLAAEPAEIAGSSFDAPAQTAQYDAAGLQGSHLAGGSSRLSTRQVGQGQQIGQDRARRLSPAVNGSSAVLSYRNDPAGWCRQFGDTPRISRLIADGDRLRPDGEFIVQGTCFGRARGSVQVTLPAPVGTLNLTPLEWQDSKLLVKLPAELSGIGNAQARVTVLRSDQLLSAIRPASFEPVWVEQDIPSRMIALQACAVPGVCSTFGAGTAVVPPPMLSALLLPWQVPGQPSAQVLGAAALHISDQLVGGRDVFHVRLPDWARVSGGAEWVERQHSGLSRIQVEVGGDLHDLTRAPGERPAATVTVDWRMTQLVTQVRRGIGFNLLTGPYPDIEVSQYGYCNYALNLKALVPRGLSL